MCGRDAGFRESGMTVTPQRIIASIRSSSRLEMPVVADGSLLVSSECLDFLIHLAQERFDENVRRVQCFQEQVSIDITQGKYASEECTEMGEANIEYRHKDSTHQAPHTVKHFAPSGSSTEPAEWRPLAAQVWPYYTKQSPALTLLMWLHTE